MLIQVGQPWRRLQSWYFLVGAARSLIWEHVHRLLSSSPNVSRLLCQQRYARTTINLHGVIVLDADDLVHSIAKSGQLLALFVQLVLIDLKLHDRLVMKLPRLLLAKGLNDLHLLRTPVKVVVKLLFLSALLLVSQIATLSRLRILLLTVLKGHLPNRGEQYPIVVGHLRDSNRQVAPFFTGLQGSVDLRYLLECLSEVARPHLVVEVAIPDARVEH